MRKPLKFARSTMQVRFVWLLFLQVFFFGCVTDGPGTQPPDGDSNRNTSDDENRITEISKQDEDTGVVPIESYPIDICEPVLETAPQEDETELPAACEFGDTRVMARHSPLYSAVPHTSVITATATNNAGGISNIRIYVVKGKMTDCSELGISPSVIPCRDEATILTPFDCPIKDPLNPETCEMDVEINNGDIVSYFAVATPVSGPDQATSAITYSGGRPELELAMPVWWHTDVPKATLSSGRIDLAIFVDPDFAGEMKEYGEHVTTVVDRVFFNPTREFSKTYTKNRHYFDIWAFPFAGASAQSVTCDHQFVGTAAKIDGMVDGSVVFHKTYFTDCASVAAGGAGSVGVGTYFPSSDWLLVHESAHFLFGLADEYGAGGQEPVSDPINIFDALDKCEIAAPLLGAHKSNCKKFGYYTETYRIDTNEPETMITQVYTSNFFDSAAAAIRNRIGNCNSGYCYGAP